MVPNLTSKLALATIVGSLCNSGCSAYKTVSPSMIPVLTVPIEKLGNKMLSNEVDYRKLTWQEAIEQVKTPVQAQGYLDRHFSFDSDEVGWLNNKGESFKYNHSRAKGNCLDYATIAAALLSDDGYSPLLLVMTDSNTAHAVYLYRTKEGYGALGNTPISPGNSSVEELVNFFNRSYGSRHDKYGVVNLDENFTREEWISGEVDLNAGLNTSLLDKWTKLKGVK